jgi:predicted metal-binding protein
METTTKIGIIICDRYRTCAGGKCLRAMRKRQGAFQRYRGQEIELIGYSTCNGCPGGNMEYVGVEMVNNGVQVIHMATGLIVGYPPCPYLQTFQTFLEKRFNVKVVIGTHPIPTKYLDMHEQLGTWKDLFWQPILDNVMTDEELRKAYD